MPDKQWVNTGNLSAKTLTGENQSRAQKHTHPSPAQADQQAKIQRGHPNAYPKCPQGYHSIFPVQAPPTQHTSQKPE